MDKKKGKRINYKIVHCSSEDPEYPATELLQQSPEAKGWQNKRFSSYPETIVVELFQPSLLNKIAVLSHQSKIATKIEFQIKINEQDDWKKLGRISLDSNVNTNFQARQLKQANANDIPAKFIRLILRQNHTNNQNIFNQVGIIALSFYGSRNQELPPVHQKYSAPKATTDIDLSTMNRIKQLEAKKKRAVEQENYDLAKDIKDQIDRLKSIALQIGSLEQRKQQAIRRQNYDDAKIINEEIKKLRQGNQTQSYEQPKPVPLRQPTKQYQEEPVESVSPISNNRTPQNAPKPLQQKPRQQQYQKQEVYQPPIPKIKGKGQSRPGDDDDRPINVKNPNPYEQPQEEEQEVKKQSELQPLNKQLYDDCSQHFSILDEQIMRHIFSKSHTNREKGIEMVQNELSMTKNRQDFIGACLYVVKNLIDDKIASVLLGTFNLMTEMLKKLKPQQSSYNQPLVDYILDRMGDYLGHVNEKIRATVEDAFGNIFPMYHLIGKDSCYRALANVGKRDKPPKILAGRLKTLNKLVIDYQLGKDYEDVIKYGVKYADDKNNDVRTGAINLLCSISREVGYNTLQPYLKNLRPPIIKSIEDKLDETGNDPQNFDQRPIKPKTSSKAPSQSGRQPQPEMQLQVGNQFIDIPKKTSSNFVNEEQVCEFCKRTDKRFVEEDYKDMHYFNACPMLTICNQCGQGIQISTLTSHLVGECSNSKYFKKCPRCKQAVHQKNYKSHVEKKECLPAKPLAAANRCPLCHLDINPGANGWKQHLVDQGCENNPRA